MNSDQSHINSPSIIQHCLCTWKHAVCRSILNWEILKLSSQYWIPFYLASYPNGQQQEIILPPPDEGNQLFSVPRWRWKWHGLLWPWLCSGACKFAESAQSHSFGRSFYAPVQETQEVHTGAQSSEDASSCSRVGGHASTRLIRDKLSATRCHVRNIKYEAITRHCLGNTASSTHPTNNRKKKTMERFRSCLSYLFLD